MKTGNIVHGGNYNGDRVTVVSDCSIIERVTDFTAARSFLEDRSVQVAGLTSTGSVTSRFGTLTFFGTSHDDLEVFTVQGSDLAAANGIYFQSNSILLFLTQTSNQQLQCSSTLLDLKLLLLAALDS